MGGRDYWESNALCLIEWPERAKAFLPEADISVEISYQDIGREINITYKS